MATTDGLFLLPVTVLITNPPPWTYVHSKSLWYAIRAASAWWLCQERRNREETLVALTENKQTDTVGYCNSYNELLIINIIFKMTTFYWFVALIDLYFHYFVIFRFG